VTQNGDKKYGEAATEKNKGAIGWVGLNPFQPRKHKFTLWDFFVKHININRIS
jgi:hypothetical protein